MKKPNSLTKNAGVSRREIIKQSAVFSLGLATSAGLLLNRRAAATELERLAEDNIQAQALGYRHDAMSVDVMKFPTADPATKNCANCQLYLAEAEADWGGCPLFAGRSVSAKGWCSAWAKRAG